MCSSDLVPWALDLLLPVGLWLLLVENHWRDLWQAVSAWLFERDIAGLATRTADSYVPWTQVIAGGAFTLTTILMLLALSRRPLRFALGIVAVLAVVVAAAAGVIAIPAWLFWRASKDERSRRNRSEHDYEPLADADREAARLRRRYVAGQLTDEQFRVGMLANLKERFAAGSLDVSEYEAEVARLLRSDVDSTPLRQLRRSTQPPAKRS